MASISHGMEIAQVEALGNKLQSDFSQRIGEIANELEKLVGDTRSEWIGPDADAFRSWWPGKRSKLVAIVEDLHGFGQSALNNASEQKQASGVGGATAPAPGTGTPGPTPGGRLVGYGRSEAEIIAAYKENYLKYGLWADGAPGGENQYQCVSWAWFRMRELGYSGPQISGDGGELAAKLGGNQHTVPQPGAVMSSPGHVFIAEEVYTNERGQLVVRISEMNSDRNPSVALPEEYQTREIVQQAEGGSWRYYDRDVRIDVWNPPYGAPRI